MLERKTRRKAKQRLCVVFYYNASSHIHGFVLRSWIHTPSTEKQLHLDTHCRVNLDTYRDRVDWDTHKNRAG